MKARLYSFRQIRHTDRQDRWYSAEPAWRFVSWERTTLSSWGSSSIIVTLQWSSQPILLRDSNIDFSHGHRASDPTLSEGHLHVRVSRSTSTNAFTTTIYRKSTFTGLMANWNSFVPFSYKKTSVVSMIQQGLSVCSTSMRGDCADQSKRRRCSLQAIYHNFIYTVKFLLPCSVVDLQSTNIVQEFIACWNIQRTRTRINYLSWSNLLQARLLQVVSFSTFFSLSARDKISA